MPTKVLKPCNLCCQNIIVKYEDRYKRQLCEKCKENPKHWIH